MYVYNSMENSLMRIAAHHRERGDEIDSRYGCPFPQASLFDSTCDAVYPSANSKAPGPPSNPPSATAHATIGGTSWDARI
jgi:hypothetical protein